MYRNSASFTGGNIANSAPLASPSKPKIEPELDLVSLLEQKRRELDAEIENFKAVKDEEFRQFEKSLRKQRQKRKREQRAKKESTTSGDLNQKPGALSLLAGAKDTRHMNGNAHPPSEASDQSETKNSRVAPLSRPTLSLDKHNVKGETTPPALGSPLPAERLSRQISRSPTHESLAYTPPKGRSSKGSHNEKHDSFAGVFTPSYLPLLESKTNKDARLSQLPDVKLQRHNSFSNSQTSNDLLSPVSKTGRSYTAPILPSTSLPSALRTASGTAVHKRKRVTFQLSDSAIVPPSSSYQEISSTEPQEEDSEEMGGFEEALTNGKAVNHAPEDEEDNGLMPPFTLRQIRSPTIKGKERVPCSDIEVSPKTFIDDIDGADDGGSGVGFFELDEEIASPGFGEVRPFDFDDVDESPDSTRDKRIGSDDDFFKKQAFEYSGSVPIDIVRPSSSWVGSFGH